MINVIKKEIDVEESLRLYALFVILLQLLWVVILKKLIKSI